MDEDTSFTYCFRFIGVDDNLIRDYSKISSCEQVAESAYFKDKSKKVLIINYSSEDEVLEIKEFIDNYSPEFECDIMVSLSSGEDSQIIGFPKLLIYSIKELDAGVTFSYTIIE